MKINYHKDTDSLYIHFNERPSDESEEIAPDTVAHFDEDGEHTGIEFYAEASRKVDLDGIEVDEARPSADEVRERRIIEGSG
ncbi:MAG: DUF2283 domain-containing protein [Rubrobacter sp.]|nr:DUF2283 domain-containing protein [Rubrobacter sp.]